MSVYIRRGIRQPNGEQLGSLDHLDGDDIKIVVEQVDEGGNVKELRIVNAPFSVVPADFAVRLHGVETLKLSKCEHLKDLSPLCGMKSLDWLTLHRCPMLRKLPTRLCTSEKPRHLQLLLDRLPLGIEMFSKTLLVDCAQMQEVPSELGDLLLEKQLYILANGKQSLPSQIGNLTKLKKFAVISDTIARLPTEIGNLVELRKLCLACCKLKRLPIQALKLPNLSLLSLRGCTGLCITREDVFECSESLRTVVDHDDSLTEESRSRLNLIIRLNRAGRGFLGKGDKVPLSLWCRVLGRCSNDADAILFFLRQKPNFVLETRKRKRN